MNSNTDASTRVVRRRRLLYMSVAGAAVLGGAGLAAWKWWRNSEPQQDARGLYSLSFQTPTGSVLNMRDFQDRPLLLNFWATWCPPCVDELPLLDSFYRQNVAKRWQVVGLAIDQPSAVRAFLQRTPVSFPVGLAGMGGTELCKSLGDLSGALPFTAVINAGGKVQQRRMGRVTQADLEQWSAA